MQKELQVPIYKDNNNSRFERTCLYYTNWGLPWWLSGQESACSAGDANSDPGLRRFPGRGNGTHSSNLAWKIPWTEEPHALHSTSHKESDTTEWLTTHYTNWCVCVWRQRGRWSWAQGNTYFKGHPRDVPIGSSGAAAACICLEIQPRDVYNFPQITPWREKWQSVSDTKNTRKQGDTDSHLLYSGHVVPKPTSWKPLCSRRITSWVVPFSSSRGHMLDSPTRTHQWAWKTLPVTLSTLRNSRVSGAFCVTSCF